MALRIEAEELDEASLQYLRAVREKHGHGSPGIFLDEHVAGLTVANMPGWGGAIGGGVLVLAFILMYALLWSQPANLALLITALVMVGGWLVVAYLRCLIARKSATYIGHFKYCDPTYLWHGTGTGVVITPLTGLLEAQRKPDPNYGRTVVRVALEQSAFDLPVSSESHAEALEVYLNELAVDQNGLPLDRGYRAREHALRAASLDDHPEEHTFDGIPEPHKARSSAFWIVRYAAVLVAFVVTYFCVYQVCRVWRDSTLAEYALEAGPVVLREYIADERNTGSRTEVLAKLKGFHETMAMNIERQNGDSNLTKGFADLVRYLHDSPTPVITMAFKTDAEKKPASVLEEVLGAKEAELLAARHIKQIATKELTAWLRQVGPNLHGQQIGEQMLAFGQATQGFAMILIEPTLSGPQANNTYRVVWNVTLQVPGSDTTRTLKWKEEFAAINAAQKEASFRNSAEGFPERFKRYLSSPVAPGDVP